MLPWPKPARPTRGDRVSPIISSGMEENDVSGRILIDVTDLLILGAGDPELETGLNRELRDLADELNSNLDGYEVALVHLDLVDYLSFEKRDPTEGAYWHELEEDRRAVAEALLPSAEDGPPAFCNGPDRAQEVDSEHTAGE